MKMNWLIFVPSPRRLDLTLTFSGPSVHELKESVLEYERDKNQKRKIRMTKTTKRNELVRPVVDVEPVPRLTCEH